VEWDVAGSPAAKVSGGTVDAYLQVINGDGSGTGTYGSQGIAYLKNKLNDFAVNFDKMLNGFAAEYQSPVPANPDNASTALVNYNPAGDAAATIDLSSEWKSSAALFANNYTGSSIGNYVGELIGKLNDSGTVTLNTGNAVPGPAFPGSILDFADSFTGDIATTVNHASSMASSTGAIVDNFDSQRKAISSVSTDEEGINIVKFQQSYNASARVITAINDMLNTLINSMAV
jgi:flagellar hook-associated protein 1 FlgK